MDAGRSRDARDAVDVRGALKSQYHAALATLESVVARCPDASWLREGRTNAFWQVAYHTLFFAHLYLSESEAAFRPWSGHQGRVQHADGIPGPADPDSDLPLLPEPYTHAQVLEYLRFCDGLVDGAVDGFDLSRPESGFSWYPMPKLEHQLVNIRHIQHHAAQLADRLRNDDGLGTPWFGARRPRSGG